MVGERNEMQDNGHTELFSVLVSGSETGPVETTSPEEDLYSLWVERAAKYCKDKMEKNLPKNS